MLECVGQFFRSVIQSCYNLEFYRTVRVTPLGRSFRYALGLVLVISLYFGLLVVLPGALSLFETFHQALEEQLPEGTELTVGDGHFITNLSPGTEIVLPDVGVIVFDSSQEGNDFPIAFEDRSGVFVGRDTIFLQDDAGYRETATAADLPDFSVTREELLERSSSWRMPASLAALSTAVMFVLRFVVGFISLLIDALLVALLALLVGRAWKLQLDYRQWLAVGLHAATLPILIDTIAGSMSVRLPFVSTAIFLMIMLTVGMDERSRPSAGPAGTGSRTSRNKIGS